MKTFNPLSEKEISEINLAIETAEKNTSAEIVPVLVKKVKTDAVKMLKAFLNINIILSVIFMTVGVYNTFVINDPSLSVPSFLAMLFIAILVSKIKQKIPMIIRKSVVVEAELEYEHQGVSETLMSNGILLFISLEDKQVVILADEKIRGSYPDATWINVVSHFTYQIKNQSLKDSIVGTISVLGEICSTVCPKTSADFNEIKNEIRIKN